MGLLEKVRTQYDHYPYPHFPLWKALFLPGSRQLRRLTQPQAGRILVAGCGTVQSTLVARANPNAQITAIDLSDRTLVKAKRIARFAGAHAIDFKYGDLHTFDAAAESYDYIVCTGVLHHCERPNVAFANLARLLTVGGTLRLMTYAPHSRMWIYEIQNRVRGMSLRKARSFLTSLSQKDPLHFAFKTYSDAKTDAGFVDGFLHALDRPIRYSNYAVWCERLNLIAEEIDLPFCPNDFVRDSQILRDRFGYLDIWAKLEVLDYLTELCVNPTILLRKARSTPVSADLEFGPFTRISIEEGIECALELLQIREEPERTEVLRHLAQVLTRYKFRGAAPFTAGDYLNELYEQFAAC